MAQRKLATFPSGGIVRRPAGKAPGGLPIEQASALCKAAELPWLDKPALDAFRALPELQGGADSSGSKPEE